MLFSPRMRTKPLAALCRRLGNAIQAGIDARTLWSREAQRARGSVRPRLLAVSEAINQGQSLADAFAQTEDFFPPLFREMIGLGEETGHLDGVLVQLAEHYENQLAMRRIFWAAIAWPLVQLGLAIVVIGLLIWVMGLVHVDVLGIGLVGDRGLSIYATLLAGVGVLLFLLWRGISRGLVWTKPIQRLVLQVPVLGQALQTLALSRLAWSMHVTMNTGMEVRRALKLSLGSTQNARYTDQIPVIDAEITNGNSIHLAFCRAGGYPADFLDTLAVGEESGKVVESMGHLARQYQEQARAALALLTLAAGWAVWAAIAALLVFLIFRLFFFYLGQINSALKM